MSPTSQEAIYGFIRICLTVLFTLANIPTATAQPVSGASFYECEGVPGEYLVKYKASASNTRAKRLAATTAIRSALKARSVKELGPIVPELELVRTDTRKEQIRSLLSSRSFAQNIEYIQPNCVDKIMDYSVSGNLRDIAGGSSRYPLAIGLTVKDKPKDENQLVLFSKQAGIQVTTADIYIPDEKGNNIKVPFEAASYKVLDVSTPRDGFHDIILSGALSGIDEQTKKEKRRLATYTFMGKGNGTYESPQPKLYSEIGLSDRARFMQVGYLNDDLYEDIVIQTGSVLTSNIHVLMSRGPNSWEESILKLGNYCTALELADINNDGLVDVVAHTADFAWQNTLHGLNGKLEYFLNRGTQGFAPRQSIQTGNYYHPGMQLKDLNLDGAVDLILLGSYRLLWALNDGSGNFGDYKYIDIMEAFSQYWVSQPRSLHVGDFTSDEYPDVSFIGNLSKKDSNELAEESVFFISNTGGKLTTYRSRFIIDKVESEAYDHYATYKDMTGDGLLDMVIRKDEVEALKVYIGTGLTQGLVNFREDLFFDVAFRGLNRMQDVFDPFGIPGALVRLRGAGGDFITFTDRNGDFTFKGLPAGRYTPSVNLDSHFFPGFVGSELSVQSNITDLSIAGHRKPWSPPQRPAVPAPNTPNDYAFNSLWGLHNYGQAGGVEDVDVDAPEAWSDSRGSGVIVGVMDSGVEITHPDLVGNRYTNAGEIPDNGEDDDQNGYVDDAYGFNPFKSGDPVDEHFHGSHVAGTIAAVGNNNAGVVGVAPEAKVLGAKLALGNSAGFSLDAIIASASYMVQAKQRGANIRVINASYGGSRECSPADIDYLTALDKADILFVAAAGNSANDNDKKATAPANCDVANVLSVAAIDRRGVLADFSNYGAKTVDVAAPGVEIQSLFIQNGYRVEKGTSMAAPHVSGVAALIFAARPDLSATQVKSLIMETVKPLNSLKGRIAAPGIVSAFNALKALGQGGGGNGGGNGGGGGDGDNGGGGGGDGDGGAGNGGGGSGQVNATYGLAFSFLQSKSSARLSVEIRSSSEAATQALSGCKFSIFGGEGTTGVTTAFKPLGVLSADRNSRILVLKPFSDVALTPKTPRKGAKAKKVFLRANAICSAPGLNLVSAPVQVKTSKRKGALSSKRWFSKLAGQLRGK
jgi:subtilisin family serine protease